MSRKYISIVTIVFNDSKNIGKTIESVLKVKNDQVEYIIIDGNSTDETVSIILGYKNLIDVFVSENDTGIYNAMNKGLRLASGDSIIFMNSGDIFHSSFSFSHLPDIRILSQKVIIGKSIQYFNGDCYLRTSNEKTHLLVSNPPHQSVFVPKSYFKENPYDESLQIAADYYWIKGAMEKCDFEIIESVVSQFSLGGRSSSPKWNDIITVQKEMQSSFYLLKSVFKYILMNILGIKLGYRIIYFSKYERIQADD